MSKELKVLNNKKLPKLTRKQEVFVNALLGDTKVSGAEAARRAYNVTTDNAARAIASENLTKPNVMQHLQANSERAEQVIVSLLAADKDEVKLAASRDILDRVHGKATQKIEQTTTGVTLTIDLTSALSDTENMA